MNIRERLIELRDALYSEAMSAVPPEYADLNTHYKYLNLDVEAAGILVAAERIDDLLLASAPEPTGDWRDEIPWDALRPEIKWVAYNKNEGGWFGALSEIIESPFGWLAVGDSFSIGSAVAMPTPPSWQESKVKRPEATRR